jgi:hypothetical protein
VKAEPHQGIAAGFEQGRDEQQWKSRQVSHGRVV